MVLIKSPVLTRLLSIRGFSSLSLRLKIKSETQVDAETFRSQVINMG